MFYTLIFALFLMIQAYHTCKAYFEEFISYVSLCALDFMGFKINHDSIKHIPNKCVVVMSHTSIYDFVICSMIYHAYFKKRHPIYFMMKEEFGTPANEVCAHLFPYTHIIPVGGQSVHGQNVVDRVVHELKDKDNYMLCIAPEGTRRRVENIRSGFYHISRRLNIPVIYCGIHFGTKVVYFEKGRKMGSEYEREKDWFISMCRKYVPLYPENCYYTTDYYQSMNSHGYDEFDHRQETSSFFEGHNDMIPPSLNNSEQDVHPHNVNTDPEESSYLSNAESYQSK